ncbi:methyltransferase domain-containing protein [Halorussus salilacus]|uniref:class I SAM-dependent methyltransferase n=1 Tax=Halorussus salilacus TaxID=2953750 RepID=UPI0020A1998E|nr:methyltransferase domain-containing protein [Halorussus salilacus]USZ69261.1 methyltransferase domain-containing protein [Halorussus salilacus]
MRQFSADYLRDTRRGMWDDREALADLELASRERVLDVGCGTGELARVLAEECPGEVVGCDADRDLLRVASGRDGPPDRRALPVVAGDALRLPFEDDAFDLVVCQALLINLPDPVAAVAEFRRVSADLVAAVEPDNSAVSVESTVDAESDLAARARRAYLDGVETDVTLGGEGVREAFAEADLSDIATRRYHHTRTVDPPYAERDLRAARRKASGEGLADDRPTLLRGDLSVEEYDDLRTDWREMGRDVIDQMREEEYRRAEVVPFYVTVGSV